MEGLSYELYPFNIYCKLIEPGGIQTDFWNRSLEITDGVKESPYSTYAEKYLEDMTEPVSSNRSSPDLVAETIYIAATDNIKQWRYLVASEEFINYPKSMTDQEWIASMMKNYLGKD